MDTREGILLFQFAEKIKSELIIGASLLNQVRSLKDEERSGGTKVLLGYLEGLLRELEVANHVLVSTSLKDLEQSIKVLIERVQRSEFEGAQHSFSEAISYATTSGHRSMTYLIEKNLI